MFIFVAGCVLKGKFMRGVKIKLEVKSIQKNIQKIDWGLRLLNVPDVWKKTKGEGIKIGVLDSGIYYHKDLQENIAGGVNTFKPASKDWTDKNGHGTHVAGIIAASDNSFGVVGVAPKAKLYSVRLLNGAGEGSIKNIVDGIDWCIKEGMDIISMSLGSDKPDNRMHEAIKRAYAANIPVIAAAGNDGGNNSMCWPANYPETIAVGSIKKDKARSDFSSGGAELDIMAPGEEIYSTYIYDKYAILSGTSMATPFITGVVALILSEHRKESKRTPIRNVEDLREHLLRGVVDLGEKGRDLGNGYGLVNVDEIFKE